MANSTSAVTIDRSPLPNGGGASASSTSTASVGTARPTLPVFSAMAPPRPTWPSHRPSGTTSTAASTSDSPDSRTCCTSSPPAPSEPAQLVPSDSQAKVSVSQLMRRRSSCRPAAAPRGRGPLGGEQQQVDRDREGHAQHRRGQHLRLEQGAQPLVDQVAESAVPHHG